jgi:hypothetical protein
MLGSIIKVLTSPAVGPVATGCALLFAALLALTWTASERTRSQLESQVAVLTRQAEGAAGWQAQLASCEATSAGMTRGLRAASSAGETAEDRAMRLAAEPPAGFDVCARMESADRAVLNTLE